MGSSYTEYRGNGFWSRDGLLEMWLEALADAVPDDAPPWLLDAREYWRNQARVGYMGCVSADLDAIVSTEERLATVLNVVRVANERLAQVATDTGRMPGSWMSERHVGGNESWLRDLGLDYVRQIADAFTALLRGELHPTSDVLPRLNPRAIA
jgi:hypothetical protein